MFRQDCREITNFTLGSGTFGDYGCAICSVAHISEQLTGRFYSPRDIQSKCIDLLTYATIGEDFYVKDWNLLINSFGILGRVRKMPANYICKDGEEEILRLKKPRFTHFVAGDGTGHYSFDSLGRRDAQKDYEIFDKWIITVKGIL